MSAGLGSIILAPAAGMSPLRAAAAVVSDGGDEIVASPRRPQVDEERLKPKPNSKSHRDSYSIDGCIQQLCGGSCFQTASSLSLSFVALSPVALPGTYVALNGQRLSPRISLALTPVGECCNQPVRVRVVRLLDYFQHHFV